MKKLFSMTLIQFLFLTSVAFSQAITPGSTVSIEYILTVDGEIVDQSEEGEVLQFTLGEPTIILGLQEQITGLNQGERKTFVVEAEKGYGPYFEDAVVEVPKAQLPAEGVEVGNFYASMDPDGNTIQGQVKEISDDIVIMDFNHPLAGKELNFEVTIVEVQ